MTLNASGNLGLGVTPSAWNSNSKALQLPSFISLSQQNSGALNLMSYAYESSANTFTYGATGVYATRLSMNPNDGVIAFYNSTTGTAGNAISFTQAMTLNASGNLSVGNTNDTYKLDVSGTGRFTGVLTGTSATFSGILTVTSSSGTKAILATTRAFGVNRNFQIAVDEYEEGQFTITPSTTQGGSGYTTPIFKLAATGAATFSSSVTATQFTSTGGRGTDYGYELPDWQIYNTSSGNNLAFSNYTVDFLTITSGGNYQLRNTVYSTSADVTTTTYRQLYPSGYNIAEIAVRTDGQYYAGAFSFRTADAANANVLVERLLIASTGAATFSSSVTATQGIFTGGAIPNLFIQSASGGTSVQFRATANESSQQVNLVAESNHPLTFWTNSTERMRITSGGLIGMGVTNPSEKLHLKDATTGYVGLRLEGTGVYAGTDWTMYASSTSPSTANDFLGFYNNSTTDGAVAGYKMSILKNGNVGIGTNLNTNGFSRLVLNGGANGNESGIQVNYGASTYGGFALTTLSAAGGGMAVYTYTGNVGSESYSERMRITSAGNVGIGTTSPAYKLDVTGEVRTSAGYLFNNQAASGFFSWYAYSGTVYVYSSAVGNLASINGTTGAYTAVSDINKKKDFELSNLGLDAVMGLKPTMYRMNSEYGTQKHLGFIAQEVKDYIPQAYVESGNFIGLSEMPLIATLTKAVQELKAELDTLKNK